MCFFHKWSKWQQYEEKGITIFGRLAPKSVQGKEQSYTDLRQKRFCKKCNKAQDVLVKKL